MTDETDLIDRVKRRLHIGDEERAATLDKNEAYAVLTELAASIQKSQYAVGMVLWHLDPSPAEMTKIAETLELNPVTLKSWMTTYSRLRKDADLATLRFSMQQQLARIQNTEDRENLWLSRSAREWTLETLTSAVSLHLESIGQSVMPRTKKAGCVASLDGRRVKVNLELAEDVVLARFAVSEGAELDDMKFEKVSKGVWQVRFGW